MLTPLAARQLELWQQRGLVKQVETPRPIVYAPVEDSSPAPPTIDPAVTPTQGQSGQAAPSPVPIAADMAGYVLEIPALDLKYAVIAGIDDHHLARGPGQYPYTPLPGESGNTGIAGHRTVKGRPSFFYALNKLKVGDPIQVTYSDKHLQYAVERVFLTTPFDLAVLDPTPEPSLTLTTCDPPGSDERRLIVRARLVEIQRVSP